MPQFVKDKRGVSPVLGVILMVALTVILAEIVAVAMLEIAASIPELKIISIQPNRADANRVNFLITTIIPAGTEMTKLTGDHIADITDKTKLEVGDMFQTNKNTPVGTYIVLVATFSDGTSQVVFASKV